MSLPAAEDGSDPAAKAPPRARSVTRKVLDILGAFDSDRLSLSLTEIADAAQLPLPTAHRLVGELSEWGALVRAPNGQHSIGLRLWEVGQNSLHPARSLVRVHLQDLCAATRQTAHLAVRTGQDALYIERVYSSNRTPRASRVGGRLPLHLTAVGKVLLSCEDDTVIQNYLAGKLARRTLYSITDAGRLARELERIREQGYATTVEEVRLGSCSIAVPVSPQRGLVRSAVGLVMPSSQAPTMRTHLGALRAVARRLERGYTTS